MAGERLRESTLLPELLLGDRTISPPAKFLYVAMEVYQPDSLTALAKLTGLSQPYVSQLCDQLSKNGWILRVKDGSKRIPLPSIPYPVQDQMVRELLAAFNVSPLKGEFLMRKWLDYLIMCDDYMDNARPEFLKNPLTGEKLELDRHYPEHRVGFEHHGPQHFGLTKQHSELDKFNELRSHDLMKAGLCRENGVTLVILTADDLTLDRLLKVIPDHMPKRHVDPKGPYVAALERLSADYKASIARIMVKEMVRTLAR